MLNMSSDIDEEEDYSSIDERDPKGGLKPPHPPPSSVGSGGVANAYANVHDQGSNHADGNSASRREKPR